MRPVLCLHSSCYTFSVNHHSRTIFPFFHSWIAGVICLVLFLSGIIFFACSPFWLTKKTSSSITLSSSSTPSLLPTDEDLADASVTEALRASVANHGVGAAFAQLRALMRQDAHLSIQCHTLTHTIGDAAYLRYGGYVAALSYNDDLCGSGYLHQIITNEILHAKDPLQTISLLCVGQDGYCYHGIGHGLMFYTRNDVKKSLEYCSKLDTPAHALRCSEGVYMQNFEDHQMYPTPFVYPKPLQLCAEDPTFKAACYHYTGSYLAKSWRTNPDLFGACDPAESIWRAKCISGIGAYLMAVHLDNRDEAVAICDTAKTTASTAACIDGLVSFYLVNEHSVAATRAFCLSLKKETRSACLSALADRAGAYK